MHRKKHSIYRVRYCPRFQASPGGLRIYPHKYGGITVYKILRCFGIFFKLTLDDIS